MTPVWCGRHIGSKQPAKPDVRATLQPTVDKINSLEDAPEFILHTGSLTHHSKPAEFDTVNQVLKGARAKLIFDMPTSMTRTPTTADSIASATAKLRKAPVGWFPVRRWAGREDCSWARKTMPSTTQTLKPAAICRSHIDAGQLADAGRKKTNGEWSGIDEFAPGIGQ